MNWRHTLLGLPFALCQSAIATAEPGTPTRVTLTANPPSVSVSPRPAGRHFVDLPTLEFSFAIEAQCSNDWVAESLFLSVADTRISFTAEQLSDNQHGHIVLRVPARQLAPVAVHDFCAIEDSVAIADSGPAAAVGRFDSPEITITAAVSAHVSLRCRNDIEHIVSYVSQPLDLTLTCGATDSSAAAD